MEEKKHWLLNSLLPSVVLLEPDEIDIFAGPASKIDPSSGGSLLRLLDARRGSRRPIEYLTPTVKLSQVFKFRVCAPTEVNLDKSSSRSLDNALYQIVASQKPDKVRNDIPYPWFSFFRRTLFQASNSWRELAEESGNTLYLPLTALVAIPSSSEDPALRLAQIAQRQPIPAYLPRLVVIVKDESSSDQQVEQVERLLRAEQPSDMICVLRLDSEKDFEESYHEVLTKVVMITQRRIFSLHEAVASQRKGLTGTFRSLFGSGYSSSSSASRAASSTFRETKSYNIDSMPYKIRLLADLLFWMRDFEGALTNYSVLRDDYQKDDALMHLGNAHEMIVMCSFLSRGVPNTYEEGGKRVELIDKAVDAYIRSVPVDPRGNPNSMQPSPAKQTPLGYRLATRAALLLLDVAPRNGFSNMKVLMKPLAHEDELCAAVILEQIALLMVDQGMARRGMKRKSGFNSLLAGSLFRSLGLDHHAWRCYASVYQNIYRHGWPAAEHHLEVNLGNLARNLQDAAGLVEYRGRCLERGYEVHGTNQHVTFLRELCESITQLPPAEKPLSYIIPRIQLVAGPIVVSDIISGEALPSNSSVDWKAMESDVNSVAKVWRRRSNKVVSYVKEPVYVDVDLINILNCDVALFDICLVADFTNRENAVFETISTKVLRSQETTRVRLSVTPIREGPFTIVGVRWRLVKEPSSPVEFIFSPKSLQLDVAAPAAHLHAVQINRAHDGTFSVKLQNSGGAATKPNSRILFCSASLAAFAWSIDGVSSEIVDEKGLVQQLELGHLLAPGASIELKCRLLEPKAAVTPCLIMWDDLRTSRLLLPSPSSGLDRSDATVSIQGKTVKSASNDLLLTLNIEGIDVPFRPLGVAAYSPGWTISPVVEPVDYSLSPMCKSWSLVFSLKESGSPDLSYISLSGSKARDAMPNFGPEDIAFRSYHADQVHTEKMILKKQMERERAELEARGELPVSIQDFRRARQRGELPGLQQNRSAEIGLPGSREAIVSRSDLVHLAVDIEFEKDKGRKRIYLMRTPVERSKLRLSVMSVVPSRLKIPANTTFCQLPMCIRMEVATPSTKVKNVCISISSTYGGQFPRPTYWAGETRKFVSEMTNGIWHDIHVCAVFSSTGVFSLNSIRVEYMNDSNKPFVQELGDVQYVTVYREDVDEPDTENVFSEIDKELAS